LYHTRRQAELLQAALPDVAVRFGMQIGNPPVGDVVRELIAEGVERLIAVPMYPQYSATTVASATDTLFKALMHERRVPAVRVVPPYYDHPAYLDAMTAVIRDGLKALPSAPEHFVLSFHGIPKSYATAGDPYATHCVRTARGLVERLGWPREKWTQSYQSLFGRDVWLKPYTDDVLTALARQGVRRVLVATTGFTADCLETIDEIGHESAEVFRQAGGEVLHRCQCLNEHPAWIAAVSRIVREQGHGWL
jgi:ferrochelatase